MRQLFLDIETTGFDNKKCKIIEIGAVKVENGEMILYGMNISPYEFGNRYNVDPLRPRKLLLNKREIQKLIGYTTQDGLTLVPLKIYINDRGKAKLELAVARGKKDYDKRNSIAKRDADRRMQQAMKKW